MRYGQQTILDAIVENESDKQFRATALGKLKRQPETGRIEPGIAALEPAPDPVATGTGAVKAGAGKAAAGEELRRTD